MSELTRETDALLRQGREGEALSPGDRTRLKRAVLAQAAAVSVVATTSTAAAWTTVAAKVIGVVVVVGSVAGAAAVLPSWTAPATKSVPAKTSVTTVPPTRAAPSTPTKLVAAPVIPAPPVTSPPAIAPAVAPAVQAPIANVTHASSPPAAPPSTLYEETRRLGAADDALKAGDAPTALSILADHTTRFPSSALAPERAAERISALCMAGRRAEARQEAARFLQEQSVGPLAARVKAACGE